MYKIFLLKIIFYTFKFFFNMTMENSSWLSDLLIKLEHNRESLSLKDDRFLQINLFNNLITKIDNYSDTCEKCKNYKIDIENYIENLKAISISTQKQKDYEKFLTELKLHLEKEHKIYPARYFNSIFSFAGMLTGAAIGALTGYLINPKFLWSGILIGWTTGLLMGKIIGIKKDKKLQQQNKQY